MMRFNSYNILLFVGALWALSSCKQGTKTKQSLDFEVKDFKTLTNWNTFVTGDKTTKLLYLDYQDAINGFTIPSIRQTADGNFDFAFTIKNNSGSAQQYYYKIYYQNESYKFPECALGSTKEHPYAQENFYGSWADTTLSFVETAAIPSDGKFHTVKNKIRIIGNPRNEKRYYYKEENQRWTRNPRMGIYSFMLVVSAADNFKNTKVPDYISQIQRKHNDRFVNPYYYFLYGEGSSMKGVFVVNNVHDLQVIAKPNLAVGVYSNPQDFDPKQYQKYYTKTCAFNENLYLNAPLGQFINNVNASGQLDNIPVIADVLQDYYSMRDFNWNRTFYKKEELITTQPHTVDCPCQQVDVDTVSGNVVMRNAASHYGDWKKQSVGVITRQGFAYGKYTVKVKLTELLNKNGIWNGITNAIWLVTNSTEPWNDCRECRSKGYLSKYGGGSNDKRSRTTSYSEIDFEILKTVDYCPLYQFPPAYYYPIADRRQTSMWNVPLPTSMLQDTGNVMVCCTNWDMACPQPDKYDVGCQPMQYGNQSFMAHRWDYWYRAITERTPASDDEMFAADYYYFQIEWKPTEIIWRIGPEKNKLRVVGYMNDAITSIPNNQMLLVISQEFHNTDWWHGSPFEQQFIPFPQHDLIGKIMEITVE